MRLHVDYVTDLDDTDRQEFMTDEEAARERARQEDELAEEIRRQRRSGKHLPGQHDQLDHGREGDGADETKLTPAQRRMLEDVRRDGERVYNGRARRTIEALQAAGLVTVEYDQQVHANIGGFGISLTERFTVRPIERKHLPGQHDQLDHAPDGDGADAGVSAIDVATKRGISGLGTLTTVESDATHSYRSIVGFRAINEYLRGIPNPRLSASEREMYGADAEVYAAELVEMFDRPDRGYTVPNDIEVYRGAPSAVFGDLQPGDTIPDKGVISTAPTRDAANGFDTSDAEETLLIITVPRGETVLPLDQFEILLKPGTEFEVTENLNGVLKLRVKS